MTDYLSEIQARIDRATPGPWDNRCREFSNTELPRNIWSEYGWVCKTENCDQVENAEFIAHSRTDLPELLSRLLRAIRALRSHGEYDNCPSCTKLALELKSPPGGG